MSRVEVFCALCGHRADVEIEVSSQTTEAELRTAIASQIEGPSLTCERCRSELIAASGFITADEPSRLVLARAAERMRRKIRGVRFAVGSAGGPRGSVWRVWVNQNDAYIAARVAASEMKVSLHASGIWRVAFTEKHVARKNALIDPARDRALDKWDRPPEFALGWMRAFVIIVPASEVVASVVKIADPDDIVWIEPVPEGWETHLTVLLSAPQATGSEGRGFATAAGREHFTEVVTRLELANGDNVWVLAHAEETTEEARRNREALRQRLLRDAADAIERATADEGPHDLRAFAGGHLNDGTRFWADIAIPHGRPALEVGTLPASPGNC